MTEGVLVHPRTEISLPSVSGRLDVEGELFPKCAGWFSLLEFQIVMLYCATQFTEGIAVLIVLCHMFPSRKIVGF